MSKFFKSATSERTLEVVNESRVITLFIAEAEPVDVKCIEIKISDAPALMLAIAEAAGIKPSTHPERLWGKSIPGFDANLSDIAAALQAHIDATEAKAKEAADREALEADALELANAFGVKAGGNPLERLNRAHIDYEQWIAVARKARELRGDSDA